MIRCTYFYETPMGFSFGDVVAESREEADRGFWSRHHRDTCRVVSVSVAREPEGEERAEDGSDGRGERPGSGAREELGPVPAAPGEGDERRGHVNPLLRPGTMDGEPRGGLVHEGQLGTTGRGPRAPRRAGPSLMPSRPCRRGSRPTSRARSRGS